MSNVPQIQSTTNYNKFKLHTRNRFISDKHVNALKNDPTFPEKFPTCPIVVDADFGIIDGQHRFEAAKLLKIPVYYIIDPSATIDDMMHRNVKMRAWNKGDYLNYFIDENPSYQLIDKIIKKHKIALTLVCAPIKHKYKGGRVVFSDDFKTGKLEIKKDVMNTLEAFFDEYIPAAKCVRNAMAIKSKPLFTESYIHAAFSTFIDEPKLFERFISKLPITSITFPNTIYVDDAKLIIERVANWKNTHRNAI